MNQFGTVPQESGLAFRPTGAQRMTLLVASLASFMAGLDALVVSTALPTIHADLHADAGTLTWTVGAYGLAFAALILTGTAVGDRLGRRRVFLAGVALFTLGSCACALSPSVGGLIAARAAQGAGGGLAVPLSLVLITEAFPAEHRGAAVGIWGAVTGLAVGAGPLVGGAIVQGLAWRWVFWVNVPIGMLLIAVGARRLAESRGPSRRLDPLGLLLAAGTIFAVTDALLHGPQAGWRSFQVLALLAGGAALGAAFVAWERHRREPMLPLQLFGMRAFSASTGARFALSASLYGGAFLIPQYLQTVRGYSPLVVGLALLPWTGPIIAIAPRAGRLADRVGERALIALGLTFQTLAFALLGLTVTTSSSYPALLGPLLLAGIGSGLAFPTTVSAALRAVAPAQVGVASGVITTVAQVGGVFGVAASAAVFTAAGSYLTASTFVDGARPALLTLAAFAAGGALASRQIRAGVTSGSPSDATNASRKALPTIPESSRGQLVTD